ncbi:MAG: DUF4956 domain-containing protein [Acidobacteria bacterium]|nr:DUF4956 domain-containing protein [Acidobacteriota bacterium]
MPELLANALAAGPTLAWETVAVRLVFALVLGRLVAVVYLWSRPGSERTPTFPTTLVLLTVLIAMVTQVIGDNVARAFSLVGALSIVRFRTVVRDTEDTAFVIFAVIVGMAVGGNNVPVAVTGIAIVTAAAFWMKPKGLDGAGGLEYTLTVRVGIGQNLHALVGKTIETHTLDHRLLSLTTAKQGLSLNASYLIRLRPDRLPDDLLKQLNGTDGVQDVGISTTREENEG